MNAYIGPIVDIIVRLAIYIYITFRSVPLGYLSVCPEQRTDCVVARTTVQCNGCNPVYSAIRLYYYYTYM